MKILTRLDRYVMGEVMWPAAMGLVTYTFLLMMRAIFTLIEQVFVRGIGFRDALALLLASMPHVVVLTLPMSFLFGVLIAMGRLNTDNEIIAMQAGGISHRRLLRPVLVLALAMFGLNGYLTLVVMPAANRSLREIKGRMYASARQLGRIEPRVFHEGFPNRLLYVQEVTEETGYWRGVLLYDRSDPGTERLTLARRGRMVSAVGLSEHARRARSRQGAENGSEPWLLLEDVVTHTFIPSKPETYRVNENQTELHKLVSQEVGVTRYRPGIRELATGDLVATVVAGEEAAEPAGSDDEEQAGSGPTDFELAAVELHKRLAIPAACIVFGLLALPLGIGSRSGGRGRGFVLSLVVILAYYVMFNNGELLALEGKVRLWLGIWLPNILLTVVALFLMRRMGSWLGERPGGVGWITRMAMEWRQWRVQRRGRTRDGLGATPLTGSIPVSLQRRRYGSRFPTLLDRYVARRLLAPFVLVLVSIAALFVVVDLTDRIDDIGQNDAPLEVVLGYYWNMLPELVLEVTPFGLLIAVLILLMILERQRELTAFKAAGLSLYRMMLPVVLIATAVTAGLWGLQESVVPAANREAKRLLDRIKGRDRTRSYRATDRQWLLSRDGTTLYNFLQYDVPSRTMIRFTLFRFDESGQLRFHLFADEVSYRRGSWTARSGWFRQIYPDGRDEYRAMRGELEVGIPESPQYFGQEYRQPAEMSFIELKSYLAELVQSGYRPVKLIVRWHQKLSRPLSAFVMVLLALPFGLNPSGGRKVSAMQGAAIALGLGICYHMLVAVFGKMGEANLLPPLVGAWAPVILAFLFAANRLTTLRT